MKFSIFTKKIGKLNENMEKVADDSKESKLRFVLNNITVEPMLGGYIVSSVLTNLATQNLYLEKACRVNLAYGTEVCDALAARQTQNYTLEEASVQELVAGMSIWKTFLQSILPAMLIIFVGSWSDRNSRRKPCMLLPICGEMMMCVGLMITTYYSWVPMQVSGFIEAIFPAMMGGWITMFMAVFSYIGNVATLETRTLRIGVVNIFCSVGIPIGTALSGIILKETGFYGVYSISLILYGTSLLYGIFFIHELPQNYLLNDPSSNGNRINLTNNSNDAIKGNRKHSFNHNNNNDENKNQTFNNNIKKHNENNNNTSDNNKHPFNNNVTNSENNNNNFSENKHPCSNYNNNNNDENNKDLCNNNTTNKSEVEPMKVQKKPFLKDFFDVKYIKDTFKVVFKNGEYNRKKRVILIMVVMIVVFGPLQGEMNVLYLFTRYKFNWDEVDFSIFSTYSMVTNLLGTMFSVCVFSHYLQIDDALIGVISCVSKILAGFVYAFAATPFVFYLGAIVDIVNGTSFIAMRSIISKMVPPDELGKINALFGVCEALDPLIYGPMYSAVYRATLNSLPGTFYLIGGALTAPAAFIFLWMYKEHKKEARSRQLLGDSYKHDSYHIDGVTVIENEHVTLSKTDFTLRNNNVTLNKNDLTLRKPIDPSNLTQQNSKVGITEAGGVYNPAFEN